LADEVVEEVDEIEVVEAAEVVESEPSAPRRDEGCGGGAMPLWMIGLVVLGRARVNAKRQ
ncbi:MAG TPA: hypothetical protein PK095_03700, partial [Myxococcota bacterium]|nr:hypothetical protein [Myxococcota bacterium]